jgi:hypothetical protein
MAKEAKTTTLGGLLAARLVEIGVTHVFGVPGARGARWHRIQIYTTKAVIAGKIRSLSHSRRAAAHTDCLGACNTVVWHGLYSFWADFCQLPSESQRGCFLGTPALLVLE